MNKIEKPKVIATRANGQPAYAEARPRKRQSDFDRKRSYDQPLQAMPWWRRWL